MFGLFVCMFSTAHTVQRCAADKITIDSKAHHTVTVGAVFSSMLVAVAVCCLVRCFGIIKKYKYCSPMEQKIRGPHRQFRRNRICMYWSHYLPTRVAFLGEKEPGFPFFTKKKYLVYLEHKVPS